jgi:hypothetical protein
LGEDQSASIGGCDKMSTENEAEGDLLMLVSNLTIKRNWNGSQEKQPRKKKARLGTAVGRSSVFVGE